MNAAFKDLEPPFPQEFKTGAVTKSMIGLKWRSPLDDGGRPIKKYHVEKRDITMKAWLSVGSVEKVS